jgi:hypothetical protein
MSGVYAVALAVGLVFILLFTGNSQENSFLYELFFAPPSSEVTEEQAEPAPADGQQASDEASSEIADDAERAAEGDATPEGATQSPDDATSDSDASESATGE